MSARDLWHEVDRFSTFVLEVVLPGDWTDFEFSSQIRDEARHDAGLVATFVAEEPTYDVATGVTTCRLTIDAETMGSIPMTRTTGHFDVRAERTINPPHVEYVYAASITLSDNVTVPA